MTLEPKLIDFFYELNSLNRIQRTGFSFLGAGRESVASHSFQVAALAWCLGSLEPGVDTHRLVLMALFHDLGESRTGDLNYVQKEYVQARDHDAVADACRGLPFGGQLRQLLDEYAAGETIEARLAHDADQLALLLELKQMIDVGCQTPRRWIEPVRDRLRTALGRRLAPMILQAHKDRWWVQIFGLELPEDKNIDTPTEKK